MIHKENKDNEELSDFADALLKLVNSFVMKRRILTPKTARYAVNKLLEYSHCKLTKNMTRKEEIKQGAIQAFKELVDSDNNNFLEIFKAGVEWADKNPDKSKIYPKQELLDMGFAFDLNGNIVTPQEEKENTKKHLLYLKSKWIEKACEWLNLNLGMLLRVFDVEYNTNGDVDVKDFIGDFKKAMMGE